MVKKRSGTLPGQIPEDPDGIVNKRKKVFSYVFRQKNHTTAKLCNSTYKYNDKKIEYSPENLLAAMIMPQFKTSVDRMMEMETIANLILNDSIAIAVVAFFMYRDLKFMSQLQQTLQVLVDAVQGLKQLIAIEEKLGD